MENGSKSRQSIGAGHFHFTHDVNHNGACLAYSKFDLTAAVARTQGRAQVGISLTDCHSCHVDGPIAFYRDGTIGRDSTLDSFLRSSVNVDKHSISRSQSIILWGGNIHVGLERQFIVIEDVTSENFFLVFVTLGQQLLQQGSRVGHEGVQLLLHIQPLRVGLVISLTHSSPAEVFHLMRRRFLLLIVLAFLAVGDAGAVLRVGR